MLLLMNHCVGFAVFYVLNYLVLRYSSAAYSCQQCVFLSEALTIAFNSTFFGLHRIEKPQIICNCVCGPIFVLFFFPHVYVRVRVVLPIRNVFQLTT